MKTQTSVSSSSFFSPSSFGSSHEQYKNVYHRKVLVEKTIKDHGKLDDELAWLPPIEKNIIYWTDNKAEMWSNYSHIVDKITVNNILEEAKPHLVVPENVRKALSNKPPELMKKFGAQYSNRSSGFNKGFKNRQFSRKSF